MIKLKYFVCENIFFLRFRVRKKGICFYYWLNYKFNEVELYMENESCKNDGKKVLLFTYNIIKYGKIKFCIYFRNIGIR